MRLRLPRLERLRRAVSLGDQVLKRAQRVYDLAMVGAHGATERLAELNAIRLLERRICVDYDVESQSLMYQFALKYPDLVGKREVHHAYLGGFKYRVSTAGRLWAGNATVLYDDRPMPDDIPLLERLEREMCRSDQECKRAYQAYSDAMLKHRAYRGFRQRYTLAMEAHNELGRLHREERHRLCRAILDGKARFGNTSGSEHTSVTPVRIEGYDYDMIEANRLRMAVFSYTGPGCMPSGLDHNEFHPMEEP